MKVLQNSPPPPLPVAGLIVRGGINNHFAEPVVCVSVHAAGGANNAASFGACRVTGADD